MKTWKCEYNCKSLYANWRVTDYILAVNKPDNNSVGHYWRSLFQYEISSIVVTDVTGIDKIPSVSMVEI